MGRAHPQRGVSGFDRTTTVPRLIFAFSSTRYMWSVAASPNVILALPESTSLLRIPQFSFFNSPSFAAATEKCEDLSDFQFSLPFRNKRA